MAGPQRVRVRRLKIPENRNPKAPDGFSRNETEGKKRKKRKKKKTRRRITHSEKKEGTLYKAKLPCLQQSLPLFFTPSLIPLTEVPA